jgi:hypothetical protein
MEAGPGGSTTEKLCYSICGLGRLSEVGVALCAGRAAARSGCLHLTLNKAASGKISDSKPQQFY